MASLGMWIEEGLNFQIMLSTDGDALQGKPAFRYSSDQVLKNHLVFKVSN
jgi:hypothetical protein